MSWNIEPAAYEEETWPVIWREPPDESEDPGDEDTPDWD